MLIQIRSLAVMIAGWLPYFLCLGLIVLGSGSALAQIDYTADDTVDQIADDGLLSLREAIDLANGDGEPSRILLLPGAAYVLSRCGSDPDDTNDTGDLDVLEDLNLTIVGDATNILQSCPDRGVLHDLATSGLLRLEGVNLLQGAVEPIAGEVGLIARRTAVLDDVDVLGHDVGILLEGGTNLVVGDSSVSENHGPGIFTSGHDVSIEMFRTDVDRNGGTGIYCQSCARLVIQESSIDANGGAGNAGAAGRQGSGIIFFGDFIGGEPGGSFEFTLEGSSVSDNRSAISGAGAVSGAGLLVFVDPFINPGTVMIRDSVFARNVSGGGSGGAIAVRGGVSIDIIDSIFQANRASDEGVPGANGGAVYYEGTDATAGGLVIQGSHFLDNHADGGSGGAISMNLGDLVIHDSILADNRAGGGGGVHGTGAQFRIFDSQIVGNRAAIAPGGGISLASTLVHDASLDLIRSSVLGNMAAGSAGVSLNNARASLENATVFFNFDTANIGRASGLDSHGTSEVSVSFSTVVHNFDSPQLAVDGPLSLHASVIDSQVSPVCEKSGVFSTSGTSVVRDASCTNPQLVDLVAPSGLNLFDYVEGVPGVLVPNAVSPLVGFVPVGDCVPTDARGVPRPQPTTGACDAGAAERIDGGIAGPAPALFIGFDPGLPLPPAAERLIELGLTPVLVDASNPVGLAERLAQARVVLVGERAEPGLLGSLAGLPVPVVTWSAVEAEKLGLTAKTTHRKKVLFGKNAFDVVTQPTELAVCDPASGDAESPYSFAAASEPGESGRAALCIWPSFAMLPNGKQTLGRRVVVAFDPDKATDRGVDLLLEAVQLAIATNEDAD
jgi:predicted outer membrane repeat protein